MSEKTPLNLGLVAPVPQSVRPAMPLAPTAARRLLPSTAVSTLRGVPPPREFVIEGLAPSGNVTILSGDGGVGKSLLALQAASSVSRGVPFFGHEVQRGAAIYLSAEDDTAELHRRLAAIARADGFDLGDLPDFHLIDLAGEDALLAVKGRDKLEKTDLFGALELKVAELRPVLLVLDTSADLFGGDEIDRAQVRQFVGLLRGLARRAKCAVLLLSHPSQNGIRSGSGTSGSTAWSNSVRSRLFFERIDDGDEKGEGSDLRLLSQKKANYSKSGGFIRLRYAHGVFVRAEGEAVDPERIAADRTDRAQSIFLTLLAEFAKQGRNVSPSASPTYAPKLFAEEDRAKRAKLTKADFRTALSRLFETGRIAIEETGTPSKRRARIVAADPAQPLLPASGGKAAETISNAISDDFADSVGNRKIH